MAKIIISDFDETLINDEEEVPTSTVILLDELRRKNNKFIVITSRPLKSILEYNHDFSFIDYIISSDGAYIYDTSLEKVIMKKNILISNVKKLINLFYDKAIIYLDTDTSYNLISKEEINIDKYDVIKQDNYLEFLEDNKSNIYKMELYFKNKKDLLEALEQIKNLNLKINTYIENKDKLYMIGITNQDINRYEAVNKIISKCKEKKEDIIFFGSKDKDIEIIKNVGVGVVVSNAEEKIKKIAKNVCDDYNHKGVEKYLREYFN